MSHLLEAPEKAVKRICVFTGSSPGARPEYRRAAEALGHELAHRGLTVVYGGARVGLMGVVADAALSSGGEVIGVIPQKLISREVAHANLTELRVVSSMHERKQQMVELADAFIALPGGFGTLEEFTEVLTWAQLGLHRKPCGLLNIQDYYGHLIALLDHAVAERFITAPHREMLLVGTSPRDLLEQFARYHAPDVPKWLDRQST